METIELMFNGKLQNCTITVDRNKEFVCEAPDGQFVKFPEGTDLQEAAIKYNELHAEEKETVEDVVYDGEVIKNT
jgi:hypothetical protein